MVTEIITPEQLAITLHDRARQRQRHSRLIVAAAGPPGVGKSTFADALRDAINDRSPALCEVLPMDGYHFDDSYLNARGWRARKGAPHTFDVGGLRAILARLKDNSEEFVAVPVFDRGLEIARAGARIIPRSTGILIVEGNYLLLDQPPWADLAQYFDLNIMLRAPEQVIRQRLLERWVGFGLSGAALEQKLEGNDYPNVELVLKHSRTDDIDFIIDTC